MSGKAIRETLGFLAVAASLVFVGVEIQQNTAVAKANAINDMASGAREFLLTVATDGETASIMNRWREGQELTPTELTRAAYVLTAMLQGFQNVFLQAATGVLGSEAQFDYAYSNSHLAQTDAFREFWPRARVRFHPDFVAAFEAEYDLAP